MVFIEMLQWGIAPGSKNLAQRPGLGSAAGMWTVGGLDGGGGEGVPARVRQLLIGAVLMLCVLSPLASCN